MAHHIVTVNENHTLVLVVHSYDFLASLSWPLQWLMIPTGSKWSRSIKYR